MDSTTIKGFKILEILAESDRPRGISELARETSFTKSNIQRILATLCSLGYAEKDEESNGYIATLRLWQLGIHVLLRNRILRASRAPMKALYSQTQETVVLCVLDNADVIYLEKLESQNPIRLSCAIGTHLPFFSTATGRVMAAYLPREQQTHLTDHYPDAIQQLPYDLPPRLEQIKRLGYETSEGGFRPGVNSIASPIMDSDGSVVASIAISGPEERLPLDRLTEIAGLLLDTSSKISASLGYLGNA